MKFEAKLKLLLYKYYFDKGFGLTNNFKYAIGLIALFEVVKLDNARITIILGIIWILVSLLVGWLWYRYDWNAAELEIQNRINPFVAEMREKFK